MGIFRNGAPAVRHYVAGGREHGGGIGRLAGYIIDSGEARLGHAMTDTRGARWNPAVSPFFLLQSLVVMAASRAGSPRTLHHLHIAGRGSTARKLILGTWARWLGLPYVLHMHEPDYEGDFLRRPARQQAAIRRLFQGARHVIVLGDGDRKLAEQLLEVPPGRVSVLRNCVPDPGRHHACASGAPVQIVFLGQLGPRKGVPELLAALADPQMPASGWQAVIAGDGPVDAYRAEAGKLGLSDRVSMPGWLGRKDAQALCAKADIIVLPSHGEAFAMAVLEGLAHGLSVVTTRVGAHDEVLKHGRDCLFVPVGDAKALAATLAELVAQPGLRARLSQGARSLYEAEFRIGGYVQRLEDLLGSLGQPPFAAARPV